MIEALIKSSGMFIDRPRITRIVLENEDDLAMRSRDEETGKVEELTIGQLFDAHVFRTSYSKKPTEGHSDKFTEWFSNKYIKGKSLETAVISIEFRRF